MRNKITTALLFAPCLLAATPRLAADEATTPQKAEHLAAKPEIVQAWQDMRFGMFICWGPVSLTGLEIGWSRGAPPWGVRPAVRGGRGPTPAEVYDNLYKRWKPDQFDAHQWVQVAQESGARYIIFLIKHHDGFCLFDTKLTDYRSTGPESAWKVDVMKAIADACHEAGMKLIVYYSQPDWHHPDFGGERHERYIQYLHGQIRELLTNYGRIDGLWFDGLGGSASMWDAENLFQLARSIQPHLIINNRCGLPGDFSTPEQRVGAFQNTRAWESCVTLGSQWSWKPDDAIKSLKQCIQILVSCAAGDGNLALNTNPMPDGRIEPRQAERFREIGRWLRRYGESIYGTRGGPFCAAGVRARRSTKEFALPEGSWRGGSTHKGTAVYLHVLRWPGDAIALPAIPRRIVKHSVLTGGQADVKQTADGIELRVPPAQRDPIDTIIKLELDGPASDIPCAASKPAASSSLAFGKKATASECYQNSEAYAPGRAVDGDIDTRWGCNYGTKSAWLEVDLGEPKTFSHAWISEPYDRVMAFELQVKEGEQWRTFHRGATIGEDCEVKFAPVTGRFVKLNLVETTDGPSIWEFQLFPPPQPAAGPKQR